MINPLNQFKIYTIKELALFGYDISFTNSSLFMMISVLVIILWMHFSSKLNIPGRIPSKFASTGELAFRFIENMIEENCGNDAKKYMPFVLSFFLFITIGNILGMLPYSFTFTSHLVVTYAMASVVFITVTIIGFMQHGLKYFKIFLPEGAPLFLAPLLIPIELISYLSRPITLSVRLFANIMAGHMVMKIFSSFVISLGIVGGLLPLGMTVILTFFEVFVALVQAYIFAILTCVYLKDALHLH